MPRRTIADLSDMIEADEIDDNQYVDIAFVPNEDRNSKLNYITVMDSKTVLVISAEYEDEPKVEMERWHEKSKQPILFLQAFSKYNTYMGEVDLHDQHCNALMPTICSKKWT